jgi:hypothetical protein
MEARKGISRQEEKVKGERKGGRRKILMHNIKNIIIYNHIYA